MKLGKAISWLLVGLQRTLFPQLEDCWKKPLTDKEQQLVSILEILKIECHIPDSARNQRMGRKMSERETIARSFVAKAVCGFRTTRGLLEALSTTPNLRRICGFERVSDIPSESTFSRAFATFAKSGLGEKVQKALVEEHLKAQLIGHISRDSTAIEGREKPVKKEPKKKAAPRKRGATQAQPLLDGALFARRRDHFRGRRFARRQSRRQRIAAGQAGCHGSRRLRALAWFLLQAAQNRPLHGRVEVIYQRGRLGR